MFRRTTIFIFASVLSTILVLSWSSLHLRSLSIKIDPEQWRAQRPQRPHQRPNHSTHTPESRLHFLIVATSSDLNLCRLLLSASVLSYPPPILIDWEGEGEFDAAKSHLAKVAGPLRYLEALSPDQGSDIVLLVDGFDVIMQLAPDVLLKRYFQEIADGNSRLQDRFGTDHMQQHDMYNSILFGPDKVCWPYDLRRAACWAVPMSPLSPDAFGPYTDTWQGDMMHARPRWLNSGTIMGPASDMLYMFQGTRDKINRTYDEEYGLRNSDQMYFADLLGDQEYARSLSQGRRAKLDIPEDGFIPSLQEGTLNEYHMGLDHRSSLFQTFAGYKEYLAWIVFNRTLISKTHATIEAYNMDLQQDVLESRNPFELLQDNEQLQNASWRDVPLGVNTASGLAFVMLHFTGEKSFRDTWWPRMWYASEAERLQRAATRNYHTNIDSDLIEGITWQKYEPSGFDTRREEEKSGAWGDTGISLSWDNLCGQHEALLYNTNM